MNQHKAKHFIIIAGESSGDIHGAQLIKNLQNNNPKISFSGLGGPKMIEQGFVSLAPMERLAVMGFWEVLKNILFFFRLEKLVLKHIDKIQPNKIILIDYPGFNLRIAKKIKASIDSKIIYYISPQLWAWKEKRIKIIQKYIDTLIVLFPFEVDWYKKRNVRVQYFGHPLVENNFSEKKDLLQKKEVYNIALCPGSRIQEIQKHLPILMNLVARARERNMKVNFQLFCAPNINPNFLKKFIKHKEVKINQNSILQSFKDIDFAIVASGTASLESAITLTPMVVIYKMSYFSWCVTRYFIKTPFASIINILSDKLVVPELLQKKLKTDSLLEIIENILKDPKEIQKQQKRLFHIIEKMNANNVYKKTSLYIANY